MLESKIYAEITYIPTLIINHSFPTSKNNFMAKPKKLANPFLFGPKLNYIDWENFELFTLKICTRMAINHTPVQRISIAIDFPRIRGSAI